MNCRHKCDFFSSVSVLFTGTIKCPIKTHSSVSVAMKTKDGWHTSVLFTDTVKPPNLAFHISKTAKLISTKFINFLPYIYTISHFKIEGNHFSISRDIRS